MTPEHILEKAQRLLRLRDNAGTEGEALAAAKALAKLIDKHRIQMVELEQKGASIGERFHLDTDQPLMTYKRATWRRALALMLAEHLGVALLVNSVRGGTKTILLCGQPSDVASLRLMYRHLLQAITRLSQGIPGRSRPQWRLGFITGVRDQLNAARQEAQRGHATAALALRCRAQEARQALQEHLGDRAKEQRCETPMRADRDFIRGYQKGRGHLLTPTPQLNPEETQAAPQQ